MHDIIFQRKVAKNRWKVSNFSPPSSDVTIGIFGYCVGNNFIKFLLRWQGCNLMVSLFGGGNFDMLLLLKNYYLCAHWNSWCWRTLYSYIKIMLHATSAECWALISYMHIYIYIYLKNKWIYIYKLVFKICITISIRA